MLTALNVSNNNHPTPQKHMDRLLIYQHIGSRQDNQDKHFYKSYDGTQLFGVFDGHGPADLAADFASKFILKYLKHNLDKLKGTSKIPVLLQRAFVKCHLHMLVHEDAMDLLNCGTTACVGIAREGKVWIAHVGDTSAFTLTKDGELNRLTKDHNLRCANEKIRVIENLGWYNRGEYMFSRINITRSLGDHWQISELRNFDDKYKHVSARNVRGKPIDELEKIITEHNIQWCISPIPEVCEVALSGVYRIVLLTDGVVMQDPDVTAAVTLPDKQMILKALEEHVAQKLDGNTRVDNVTVLVLHNTHVSESEVPD